MVFAHMVPLKGAVIDWVILEFARDWNDWDTMAR